MIKDLYKNKEAKKWRENHGSLECDQDLGERVYTSRLIGENRTGIIDQKACA